MDSGVEQIVGFSVIGLLLALIVFILVALYIDTGRKMDCELQGEGYAYHNPLPLQGRCVQLLDK